ncbi:heme-binding protein [Caulobacter hibisci]|uniref:heme-binding protein n=1 Tax=Caulobacter hibisci TaxID=2035993 RepID=UPI0018E2FCBE
MRKIEQAQSGDPDLGPLALLPGIWANLRDPQKPDEGPLNGRGWNMIALPFATAPGEGFNYRLLMNQYNERLVITTKDTGVPNRGIQPNPPVAPTTETDQALVALDYEQGVVHIATADFPASPLKQPVPSAIHHEPGLFLFMKNQTDGPIDIARLGTIPHGDSILALGDSEPPTPGAPVIPPFSGLPIGVGNPDPETSRYLAPYKHFIDNPFENLFRPDQTHALLVASLGALGPIKQTTTLRFSTKISTAGIINIPFVVDQANPTEMESTFWIMELEELGSDGLPRLIMMYHQVVMLDFFKRTDNVRGLIKWPHVSINTMERISAEPPPAPLASAEITCDAL